MQSKTFQEQNELFYALNHYLNSDSGDFAAAKKISDGYKNLWIKFSGMPTASQTVKIEAIKPANYQNTPYATTIRKIISFSRKELTPFISSFVLHGSLATMDFVPGFSDMDTFVFIKKEVCANPGKLEELRKKISAIKPALQEIDHLSHHGFIFCNEENLRYYHQRFLPVEVFRYAKSIISQSNLTFHVRDSSKENWEQFEHYYSIFKKAASTGKLPNKPGSAEYQLKWFTSMMLLMPNLYLQTKEIYLYKKFAFDLVKHPFLQKLSAARKNWSKAEKILGKNYYKAGFSMLTGWRNDLVRFRKEKFTNQPKRIALKVYAGARDEMTACFSKNPDILAAYEYGSVSAPGISDIDPIAVLRKNPIKKWQLPDGVNIRKVAKGGLMVMPEEVFRNILWLDDLKIKPLYKKGSLPQKPPKMFLKLRDLAGVVDWLPERMIRLIIILKKPSFDVQYALRYTRSFAYALEDAAQIIGRQKESDEFLSALKELRGDWHPSKSDELRQLVRTGLRLGCDILSEFSEKIFKLQNDVSGHLTFFPGQEIIFTADSRKINSDWSFANSTEKTARIFVSSALLPHFAFYASQKGIIGAGFRKNILINGKTRRSLPVNYRGYLAKKISIANENADFLRKSGFHSGQYKFGFYLN